MELHCGNSWAENVHIFCFKCCIHQYINILHLTMIINDHDLIFAVCVNILLTLTKRYVVYNSDYEVNICCTGQSKSPLH